MLWQSTSQHCHSSWSRWGRQTNVPVKRTVARTSLFKQLPMDAAVIQSERALLICCGLATFCTSYSDGLGGNSIVPNWIGVSTSFWQWLSLSIWPSLVAAKLTLKQCISLMARRCSIARFALTGSANLTLVSKRCMAWAWSWHCCLFPLMLFHKEPKWSSAC